MELLRNWISALTAASAAAAIARQITPSGPVKKMTELSCAIMLLGVMLSMVVKPDMETLAGSMSEYRRTTAVLTEDMETVERQLLRSFIEEQCAAYILDEAAKMEIENIQVSVSAKWRDENWVPYEAQITGETTPMARQRLESFIESELGISAERQYWNG